MLNPFYLYRASLAFQWPRYLFSKILDYLYIFEILGSSFAVGSM